MYTNNASNQQSMSEFLEFCNSIDLSEYHGATFQVGSEVTGVIGEE